MRMHAPSLMAKRKSKHEITIRSSAAEYLTFVSTIGDQSDSVEFCRSQKDFVPFRAK